MTLEDIKKMDKSKLGAVHALNLCTVSVSQIIQYHDLNIMEQEYEAILNNLNLENIEKDDALLDILRQILNVITFFRIMDGDKKMIDRVYQQKMKDAIWSAIPSPTMVMATNPISLAVSIAAMVGTSYMNYRKAKSENSLEYDQSMWQLQKSAIEQLNALRRELFSTAWKLAEHYGFNDCLRLSENQIKQYNEILTDNNLIRKYYRLKSIQEKFYAYPPFWYQFGHAANILYSMSNPMLRDKNGKVKAEYECLDIQDLEIKLTDTSREFYKNEAKRCFDIYWEINDSPLLREDQMASACALEHVDLLIKDNENKDIILKRIEQAVEHAGNSLDIIQLCVMAYMQIGEIERTIPLLEMLVNEEHNTEINAQLLSGRYIALYHSTDDEMKKQKAKADYDLLCCRMNTEDENYLIPWDAESDGLFIENQKSILTAKYYVLIDEIEELYNLKFGCLLPGPEIEKEYSREFFLPANKEKRIKTMKNVLSTNIKADEYLTYSYNERMAYDFIDLYNELFDTIEALSVVDAQTINEAHRKMEDDLKNEAGKIYEMQSKIARKTFGRTETNDVSKFFEVIYSSSRHDIFESVKEATRNYIKKVSDIREVSKLETGIMTFCNRYKIQVPVIKNSESNNNKEVLKLNDRFEYTLLGEYAKQSSEKKRLYKRMESEFAKYAEYLVKDGENVKILLPGKDAYWKYFDESKIKEIHDYKQGCFGVIKQLSRKNNYDLLFTDAGIICVTEGKLNFKYDYLVYSDVEKDDDHTLLMGKYPNYSSTSVDVVKLFELIQNLANIMYDFLGTEEE